MNGLPPSALKRLEDQRASGVTGSLLSSAATASVHSAGLAPVGEVFGCLVVQMGWQGGGCGWYGGGMMGPGGFGGISGFGGAGSWPVSPITTSGSGGAWTGFTPYVQAYEAAWHGALQRMLAEARALGAHGVVGVRITRTRMEGLVWEFSALGTAVRSVDPLLVPRPANPDEVWCTNLSAEDCAAAILSGYLPREIVMGMSISTKHEDMQLRQQRSVWMGNTEVEGVTELIRAAREESRALLVAHATHVGGAELVITDMGLSEFDTACGQEADLHAESVMVGTTLVPIPGGRARTESTRAMTVLPLRGFAT
jgi:uncharacterized protein YbjQ (UPF0145 family)